MDSLQTVARRPGFPYDGAMTARTDYSTLPWRHVALAWLALGLFDGAQTVVSMRAMDMHHAWVTLFFVTTAIWSVWALFTPIPLLLLRRFPLPSQSV